MTVLSWYCLACYGVIGLFAAVAACSSDVLDEIAQDFPGPVPTRLVLAMMLAFYALAPLALPAVVLSGLLRRFRRDEPGV